MRSHGRGTSSSARGTTTGAFSNAASTRDSKSGTVQITTAVSNTCADIGSDLQESVGGTGKKLKLRPTEGTLTSL